MRHERKNVCSKFSSFKSRNPTRREALTSLLEIYAVRRSEGGCEVPKIRMQVSNFEIRIWVSGRRDRVWLVPPDGCSQGGKARWRHSIATTADCRQHISLTSKPSCTAERRIWNATGRTFSRRRSSVLLVMVGAVGAAAP